MSELHRLPCPAWCAGHDLSDIDVRHRSGWRSWNDGDSPQFEMRMIRYDEPEAPSPDCIGMIDFEVRVRPIPGIWPDDDEIDPIGGYFEADAMRKFAAWLLNQADEADPHRTNGKPLEWCQTART